LIGVTLGCDLEEVGIELLPRVIGMGEKHEVKALSLPGDNLLPRGDQTFKLLLSHHVGEVPGNIIARVELSVEHCSASTSAERILSFRHGL
jgi:hypothetical protein